MARKAASDHDPWSRVHSIEHSEQRRFAPLTKTLGDLNDENLASVLKSIERDGKLEPLKKVLIPDLLFELAWISDFRRTSEPYSESVFWDDLRCFIQRERNRTGEPFRFPSWAIHVGRMIAEAWMRRDGEFFLRHANLWRELCEIKHGGRHPAATNVAAICRSAIALHYQHKRNPTKKEVRDEVAKGGLRIGEKDWPKYFRKCGLTFLPQAKAGRPRLLGKSPDSRKSHSDSKAK
jgi:hypothetical protein